MSAAHLRTEEAHTKRIKSGGYIFVGGFPCAEEYLEDGKEALAKQALKNEASRSTRAAGALERRFGSPWNYRPTQTRCKHSERFFDLLPALTHVRFRRPRKRCACTWFGECGVYITFPTNSQSPTRLSTPRYPFQVPAWRWPLLHRLGIF